MGGEGRDESARAAVRLAEVRRSLQLVGPVELTNPLVDYHMGLLWRRIKETQPPVLLAAVPLSTVEFGELIWHYGQGLKRRIRHYEETALRATWSLAAGEPPWTWLGLDRQWFLWQVRSRLRWDYDLLQRGRLDRVRAILSAPYYDERWLDALLGAGAVTEVARLSVIWAQREYQSLQDLTRQPIETMWGLMALAGFCERRLVTLRWVAQGLYPDHSAYRYYRDLAPVLQACHGLSAQRRYEWQLRWRRVPRVAMIDNR